MKTPPEQFRKANWHCHKLAELLHLLNIEPDACPKKPNVTKDGSYRDAAEWLQLAAELKTVELDVYAFDTNPFMCGSAMDFDDARGKFQSELALRIVRFNFAWNAFEIACNTVSLKPHPKSRKSIAKAATWFIKQNDIKADDFPGYFHLLEHAQTWGKDHPYFSGVLIPEEWDRSYINEAGYGLELCRQLRNKLAHGATAVPVPEDWRTDNLSDKQWLAFLVVVLKLLLISIQMILVCALPQEFVADEDSLMFDVSGNDVIGYLKTLHLDQIPRDQMT